MPAGGEIKKVCLDYACWQKPSIFGGRPCLSNNQTWCHQVLDWISEIWSSSHGIYRSLLGQSRQNTTHQLWNDKTEIWSQQQFQRGCCFFFANRKIYLVHFIAIVFFMDGLPPAVAGGWDLWGAFKAKAPSGGGRTRGWATFRNRPKNLKLEDEKSVWKIVVLIIWWLWN